MELKESIYLIKVDGDDEGEEQVNEIETRCGFGEERENFVEEMAVVMVVEVDGGGYGGGDGGGYGGGKAYSSINE
ncbi:hypothetical protein L1987_11074 [Smallanthus sonchifolius]|uniref:Uncharacterized protein n=1 Tax=Smallanthus sonchifolius TaxID=185202 RepID=A0ACB9JBZ5_9ASTR|nr:hypothetical protein L1987_11074 [Smallanthus sonchifolius]